MTEAGPLPGFFVSANSAAETIYSATVSNSPTLGLPDRSLCMSNISDISAFKLLAPRSETTLATNSIPNSLT